MTERQIGIAAEIGKALLGLLGVNAPTQEIAVKYGKIGLRLVAQVRALREADQEELDAMLNDAAEENKISIYDAINELNRREPND